jgi:FkbM family methyltransferase
MLIADLRRWTVNALFQGLRWYTRRSPFHRGRGAFIRPIEMLKRRGWPAPLITIGSGMTMEFEPSLLGWTLFEHGEWEPAQTALILELLTRDAVVLDVGANTGYYALLAAAVVGPGGSVHAFEIQPAMIEILSRNVALNGLQNIVRIVEAGCFSAPGEAVIELHGDPGSARVSFAGTGLRVPLITIDHYVRAAALDRVDVIVIDTEGADIEILKGAAGVLEQFHPIVIAEAHLLEAFGGSEEEMIELMSQFGYSARPILNEFSRDLLFLPPR